MNKLDKTAVSICLKEEQVTYAVGVPLAVYIVMFCGNFAGEQIKALMIGVGVSAVIVSPTRFMINFLRMKRVFRHIQNASSDIKNITESKERLFREPLYHAWSIALAWLFATTIAFLVAHLLTGLIFFHIYVLLLIWSVTMPSGFIIAYFITEKNLSTILADDRVGDITRFKRKKFSIVNKVIISLVTLGWYPTAVLSFILLEIYYKVLVFDNIILHVGFIVTMMVVIILLISYMLISSLKLTLAFSMDGLSSISKHNLSRVIPEITSDEIGTIAQYINKVATNMKVIVKTSFDFINVLKENSNSLTLNMEDVAVGSMAVASSMEEVSASVEELAASSDSIAINSKEQSDFTNRVSSFFESLIDKIDQFEDKSKNALSITNDAMETMTSGGAIMRDTLSLVNEIHESTLAISQSVDAIKDIADQVNLLALNASIEAARAGDYGRGFSVVAEEISKLADTTQSNADEIIKRIQTIVQKVKNGIKAMELLGDAFVTVQEKIGQSSSMVQVISAESIEQKKLSVEVKGYFSKLLTMTQDNLKATEEQSIAYQEISKNINDVSGYTSAMAEKAQVVLAGSKEIVQGTDNLVKGVQVFTLDR